MRLILCHLNIGLYSLSRPRKESQDVKQGHKGCSKSGTIKIDMGFSRNGDAATVGTNAERRECTCVSSAQLQPTFVVPRLSCPPEVILCDGDTGHGKRRVSVVAVICGTISACLPALLKSLSLRYVRRGDRLIGCYSGKKMTGNVIFAWWWEAYSTDQLARLSIVTLLRSVVR